MDNRKFVSLLAPGVDEEELAKKADLVDGKVPASELPSYVDDVIEYASLADFPAEGEGSKIYVALDTGFTYRWGGSEYTQIGGQDLSDYYTKTEADALLAGKQQVGDYATNAALESGLATKQAVGDYATNTALADGLAMKQNVGDYATNSALQAGLATKQDVGDYATNSALTAGLATKQDVGDYATNTALSEGLATKQPVGDYATRAELAALPDLEIVTYQDQTPLTEAQLAKAVDGKLAIYCNGRLYTKYYEGASIINFHAFDIGHNIGSSVNVSDTMRSQEYVILLNRDTRMLSNTGAMPVSSIGDYAANFLDAATAPAVDGKKLIREANLALYATSSALTSGLAAKQDTLVSGTNIKTVNGSSILGSGDLVIDAEPTEATELEIRRLFRTKYDIVTTVVNGSYAGDTELWTKETAAVNIAADNGYLLPETIAVSGAAYTYDDITGAIALSAVTGNVSINAECELIPPPPGGELVKGDIIHFDALGDGTQKRFKVMKVDENNTTLMSLDDSISSVYNKPSVTDVFDDGKSYQKYEDSALDSMINTTYYNSLSARVKAAIIPTNRIQSCYRRIDGASGLSTDLKIQASNNIVYGYNKVTQKTVGNRNCFALDIDDIKDYFGDSIDVINYTDIVNTFFNETVTDYIWTASAHVDNHYGTTAFGIGSYFGFLNGQYSDNNYTVRPVFRINLSTIEYSKE